MKTIFKEVCAMKLKDYIKLGAGFYIGYEMAKSIDKVLGHWFTNTKLYKTVVNKDVEKEMESILNE